MKDKYLYWFLAPFDTGLVAKTESGTTSYYDSPYGENDDSTLASTKNLVRLPWATKTM